MKSLRVVSACALAVAALVMASCQTPPATGGNTPPTASFTATPLVGLAPLPVNFDASASFDTGGTITAYEWTFGDGATATGVTTSHTFTLNGTYQVQLKVTDNGGASATTSRTITVGVANVPPTAIAGVDHASGIAPLGVTFSSAGSGDVDGSIVTWAWDFGDGTAPSNAQNPAHTYATPGNFTAVLTVTDDDGAVASDSVTVNVTANQAPVAASSATPSAGKAPLNVAFSSSGSSDPDGGPLSYSWNFDDGTPTSNAANPAHTYTAAGTYNAVLTVTDAQGATAAHTSAVVVNANQAPVAVAGANVTSGPAPLVVTFDATGSTDGDGTISSYLWTFPGGVTSNVTQPQFTFAAQGTYSVTLAVTDDNGATSSDTVSIVVGAAPNVAPTAVASATPTTGKRNLAVTFNSSASTDSDGTIVSRSWTFGDGGTSTAANPSHTYLNAGTFTATLTVTDNAGAISSDTVVITVTPNQAPVASGTATPSTQKQGKIVNFSSAGSSDPDGTIASYLWDFKDGSPTSSSANPAHTYTNPGTYQVALTVTDDTGDATIATVTVVVVANQAPTAVINATPQTGPRPLAVTFSSAGSADSDGTFTTSWTFGNGNTSAAADPTTTYNSDGVFTATLTVTDDNGATDSKSIVINVTIDDDGDGVSPPADCNDNDAAIYPGAPDTLDAAGKDTNCDGIDGIAADTVLVSASAGSNVAGCGIPGSTPCQSIPFAITEAGASRHTVLVTGNASAYAPFSLATTNGMTVRGGYGADFVSRSGTTTVNGGVTISSSTSATLADLTVNGTSGANPTGIAITGSTVTLKGLEVTSGTATGAGSSAYGVRATGSTVAVQSSTISAASGVAGISGTTPGGALTAGTTGIGGTNGAQHGVPGGAAPGTGSNSGGNGGNGDGSAGITGANGGAGGLGGCNNCVSNNNYSGGGAKGGKAGANGAAGTNGAAAAATWGASFSATASVAGGTAANGGGGGGGGGGGRACDAGACAGQWTGGGSGGGGGGGGQGGGGGTSGTSGGGSFAVYSHNSTVTIDANTMLSTGNGGNAGNGAAGQNGAAGGAGGKGGAGVKADCCTGTGGSGGAAGAVNTNGADGTNGSAGTCCNAASGGGAGGAGGGNGGKGGTGGGGIGGPSIAMANVGTGSITFGGNVATQVSIGAGGTAGAAPGGNSGAAGAAVKQASF